MNNMRWIAFIVVVFGVLRAQGQTPGDWVYYKFKNRDFAPKMGKLLYQNDTTVYFQGRNGREYAALKKDIRKQRAMPTRLLASPATGQYFLSRAFLSRAKSLELHADMLRVGVRYANRSYWLDGGFLLGGIDFGVFYVNVGAKVPGPKDALVKLGGSISHINIARFSDSFPGFTIGQLGATIGSGLSHVSISALGFIFPKFVNREIVTDQHVGVKLSVLHRVSSRVELLASYVQIPPLQFSEDGATLNGFILVGNKISGKRFFATSGLMFASVVSGIYLGTGFKLSNGYRRKISDANPHWGGRN